MVLGGTLASAVLVSLAGAARAPDVDAPLPPPPQTAAEAEGMGLFAAAVNNNGDDDDAPDGVVALYVASRAELRSALVAFGLHCCGRPSAFPFMRLLRMLFNLCAHAVWRGCHPGTLPWI